MNQQIETIAEHYLIACLWADAPEGTSPRVSNKARVKALAIATDFWHSLPVKFRQSYKLLFDRGYGAHPDFGTVDPVCAAIGHDLYLTSQRAGVGFWDRDALGETLGRYLSKKAEKYEKVYPEFYRGWLYLHGNF